MDLQEAKDNLEQAQNFLRTSKAEFSRLVQDKKRQRLLIDRLDDGIKTLRDKLEEATPQTGALEHLESELKSQQDQLTMSKNAYQDAVLVTDGVNEKQRASKAELDELDKQIEAVSTKIVKATNKVKKLDEERSTVLIRKNSGDSSIRVQENMKEQEEERRVEQQKMVNTFLEEASKICPRVVVEAHETEESLNKLYKKLSEDLVRARREYVVLLAAMDNTNKGRMGGSEDELKSRELESKVHYEEKCRLYEDNLSLVKVRDYRQ